MTALIIYDDTTSAATAVTTLQHAAHCAELDEPWNIKPWRVDVLRLSLAADEALREAADVDLIVLTGPQAYQPPTWLKEWLECWAQSRQVGDAALAVLRESTRGGQSARGAPELCRFAVRHGLSFISETESVYEHVAGSVVRTQSERRLPAGPATEGTMSMPNHDSYRGWGIND